MKAAAAECSFRAPFFVDVNALQSVARPSHFAVLVLGEEEAAPCECDHEAGGHACAIIVTRL